MEKMFPEYKKLRAKLEQKRKEVQSRPLTEKEVQSLLYMYENGKPLFKREDFYSKERKEATPEERRKLNIPKYRPATKLEANLLYCDVYAREIRGY